MICAPVCLRPTEVSAPGNSAVAYANYATVVVKSVYYQTWAWTLPDNIAGENENVKVSVTSASDGTVINARIITSSSDAALDASVQRTLEPRYICCAVFRSGTDRKRADLHHQFQRLKPKECLNEKNLSLKNLSANLVRDC